MASANHPTAIEIMSLAAVAEANEPEHFVAAFSPDLTRLLWANAAAALVLGVAPGRQAEAAPLASSPTLRQIQAVSRALQRNGATTALLRGVGPGMGSATTLQLALADLPDTQIAVAVARDIARAAASDPARLQAEIGEEADVLAFEGPFPGASAAFAEDIADFRENGEPRREFDRDGRRLSLARVGSRHLAVKIADVPVPQVDPAKDATESPVETRPRTSIGALLERWHSRLEAATPSPRNASAETGPAETADATSAHEAVEAAAPPVETAQPVQPYDAGGIDQEAVAEPLPDASDPIPAANDTAEVQVVADIREPENAAVEPEEPDEVAPVAAPEIKEASAPDASSETPEAPPFEPDFDRPPSRFVWRIDNAGRFRSISAEFALAVGPRAADVIDLSFREVASAYALDRDRDVERLLARRDTWSGRTIFWPVENSDRKVPIDLAALPVYARDRSFDGFRGFGIVRLSESVADPEALGLALSRPTPLEAQDEEADDSSGSSLKASAALLFEDEEPTRSFGRRALTDRPAEPEEEQDSEPKVIRLEERRRGRDGTLSQIEEAAFRAIGATLGRDEDKPRHAALPDAIRAAASRVQALEAEAPAEETVDLSTDANPGPAPGEENGDLPVEPALLDELEAVYGTMPLAVLVQIREELVYANRRFLDLTGHAQVGALSDSGGLASLFAESEEEARPGIMRIRASGEAILSVCVHMQRLSFVGRSCLVMSFVEAENGEADETGIQRENDELRALIEAAADGVVVLDTAGRIREMNGSALALFGLREADLPDRPFVTLFAHESQKAALDHLDSVRRGAAAALGGREVIGRGAGGRFLPLAILLRPLPAGDGVSVLVRDISHQKSIEQDRDEARREAEASGEWRARFLTDVGRELRDPLDSIVGFADVIASESFGPLGHERYLEYLDDIKRSGQYLLELVDDLLDLAKIESGQLELAFESVLLNDIVSEVVSQVQPRALQQRIILRSNLPSSVPPVVADRACLQQIAANLVANAIRFTPSGGQIIVSTSYSAGGAVVMRVRDSGVGMTDREIEAALTPFAEMPAAERGRGEGSGLGLSLTKALAQANRASFTISSAPGEGTLVEVAFPSERVLAD